MSNLDQLVKGAPPPGNQYPVPSTSPIISPEASNASSLSDPLASLPSSPPQIYLNLLILEASLRAQWLQLRTRRRQHTFFLTILAGWICYFAYALFFAPREDGSGVGGSVYWVVEVAEKVCLMGGIITGILVWATGQWERGIRWPRRWYPHANRGVRGFNCKLVIIKMSWYEKLWSTISYLFLFGPFLGNSGTSYRYVDQSLLVEAEKASRNGGHHALPNIHEKGFTAGHEEDLAPGGDYVKLLLLPKPFSPTFRENWEIYRSEYWEKENERRAILLKKIKERDRKIAKERGGWLWWIGYHRWSPHKGPDIERPSHTSSQKEQKHTRSGSFRSGSHSRNSSRSVTPTPELDDGTPGGHGRRGSTSSLGGSGRRKKKASGPQIQKLTSSASLSVTPEVHSPLARENSFASNSSVDTDRPATPLTEDGDGDSVSSRSTRQGSVAARSTGKGTVRTTTE
jgi:hypothetical protein